MKVTFSFGLPGQSEMAVSKSYWSYILSTCLLIQCLAVPVLSAPPPGKRMIRAQPRQSPLSPSQFALAATRFIVMLPFLPLMMAIPGVTGVMMPLFMALQDRLRTMIPNMGRPSNSNNNNASPSGGVVTNLLTAFNGGGGSNVNPISQTGTVSNLLSALGLGGGNSNSQNQNQQGSAAEAVAGSEDSASEVPSFFRFKRSLPREDMNKGIGEVLDFLSKSADAFSGRSESKPNDQESSLYGGNEDEIREVFDFLYSSAIGGLVKNNQEQLGSGTAKDTLDPLNITSALAEDFKEVVDFFQLINHAFSHNGEADAFEGASESSHKDNQNSQIKRVKRGILKLPTKALNEGFKEVFEILHKTDDALNMLTSGQPDCRRQAVCRLHHKFDPSIGSFLGNLIEVLQLESKVEKLDISLTTRSILKDILKAANTGLFQKDCSSVYSRCSISAF